ncbi:cytochrome P450 [Mycena galopus ATCC 62051]|nr:cytochrome P450 [Mycena galopus ATCC 62051]
MVNILRDCYCYKSGVAANTTQCPMMIIALSLLASIIFALLYRHYKKPQVSLPPGPTPIPFIGNIHQLPPVDPFKTYASWTNIYGPIVYMHFFGRQFIVLNRLEDVVNLFEKRSARYSTKPRLVMAGELVGREKTSILFVKYGPFLQKTRQILHSWINASAVKSYYPSKSSGHSRQCRGSSTTQPNMPTISALTSFRTAGSVILKLTYGIDTKPVDDPWMKMAESLVGITAEAAEPGRWLVDSFPSRQAGQSFYVLVLKAQGSQDFSWTASQLNSYGVNPTPEQENALICAAGSIYAGGIDTVTITIRTFILMMIRHPEIQRRAQADIDRVVGLHRLPQMSDMDSLPYISHIIKETLRINPVAPLIPHSTDEDDVYNGYQIPKGTWIMANAWAINYDHTTYKDPETFNPSRFETTDKHVGERDPGGHIFGFGRRLCPGYHLSQASLFLYTSHLLSVFDMAPVPDQDGNCVPPPAEFFATHLRYPKPFLCSFKPRSEEKIRLVHDTIESSTA